MPEAIGDKGVCRPASMREHVEVRVVGSAILICSVPAWAASVDESVTRAMVGSANLGCDGPAVPVPLGAHLTSPHLI